MLAVLLPLVVIGTGAGAAGLWWHYKKPVPHPLGDCAATTLHVVAAPEIAAVVKRAARALNPGGADCGPVSVLAQEPSITTALLNTNQPDVWIPSSTAWLGTAALDGGTFGVPLGVLAHSPVIVVAPPAVATALWPQNQTSWADVVAKVNAHQIAAMSVPDPLQDNTGLLTVLGVSTVMTASTPDPGIAQLRTLSLRSHLANASTSSADLFKRYAEATDPAAAATQIGVFTATEQQLLQYNRNNPAVRLVGVYPTAGLTDADYPMVTSRPAAADPARQRLTAQLAERLGSAELVKSLVDAGFRAGPVRPTTPGASPSAVTSPTVGPTASASANPWTGAPAGVPDDDAAAIPIPADAKQVITMATEWSQYRTLRFQVLILVDTSGSMNDPATAQGGTNETKADLLRESGANVVPLFGDETSLGLWYFGSPAAMSPAYVEAVPFGPLDANASGGASRRGLMAQQIANYRAIAGAATPLYEAVLDGVKTMEAKVAANVVTLVVVLTDGRDESSRFAMPRQTFLSQLAAQEGSKPAVPVFTIGYGPDADVATLQAMSTATGGQSSMATRPTDLATAMAKLFLAAHTAGR